jgi:hypothetical protein
MEDRCIGIRFPTEARNVSLLLFVHISQRPTESSQQVLFPLVSACKASLHPVKTLCMGPSTLAQTCAFLVWCLTLCLSLEPKRKKTFLYVQHVSTHIQTQLAMCVEAPGSVRKTLHALQYLSLSNSRKIKKW